MRDFCRAGALFLLLLLLVQRGAQGVKGAGPPLCLGTRLSCSREVSFHRVQCQLQQLHHDAHRLLRNYLQRQGPPFWDPSPSWPPQEEEEDALCPPDPSFPPFSSQRGSRKATLASLYQAFAYFNTSLGALTADQEDFFSGGEQEDPLLGQLRWTSRTVRGLLANLGCLLCPRFPGGLQQRGPLEPAYASPGPGADAFAKKRRGCQVLKGYAWLAAQAARALASAPHLRPPCTAGQARGAMGL